jgi:hypothetical protein
LNRLDFNTENLNDLKISDLKRIAEYWFRHYILSCCERDHRNRIKCPLKNKWYKEDKMQVAHFRDRNHLDTAFDLDNCHLISESSNLWDSKVKKEGYKSLHHYEYEIWLRTFLEEEKINKYLHGKRDLTIFARDQYKKAINDYRRQ